MCQKLSAEDQDIDDKMVRGLRQPTLKETKAILDIQRKLRFSRRQGSGSKQMK